MKRRTRKILALVCALCMMVAATTAATIFADEAGFLKVHEVARLKGMPLGTAALLSGNFNSGYYVSYTGTNFNITGAIQPISGLAARGIEVSHKTIGYSDDWADADSWEDGTNTAPNLNTRQISLHLDGTKGTNTGILMHVNMPEVADKTATHLWMQMIVINDQGSAKHPMLLNGTPFYTLQKDAVGWESKTVVTTSPWTVLSLPMGFEGYINIPFTSFNSDIIGAESIQTLHMALEDMSATEKTILGPVFIAENDVRVDQYAQIEGEEDENDEPVLRDLLTGYSEGEVIPPADVMHANLIEKHKNKNFPNALENGRTVADHAGWVANHFQMTGVSPISGLNARGAEVNSIEGGYSSDWVGGTDQLAPNHAERQVVLVVYEAKGSNTGIMMYVKLPEIADKENTHLWFQMIDRDTSAHRSLSSGASVYTLAKNAQVWEQKTTITVSAVSPGVVVKLPTGFEGYINIPFSSVSAPDLIQTLSVLAIGIEDMSGSESTILGPIFMTSNNIRSGDQAWLNGEADSENNAIVRSLFGYGSPLNVYEKLIPYLLKMPDSGLLPADVAEIKEWTQVPGAVNILDLLAMKQLLLK